MFIFVDGTAATSVNIAVFLAMHVTVTGDSAQLPTVTLALRLQRPSLAPRTKVLDLETKGWASGRRVQEP